MSRPAVRPALRLASLLLPLAGLAAAWIATHSRARQGVEWDVPVKGYDPRDLLRGHYIAFQYDWPGLARGDYGTGRSTLCLEGTPPTISRTLVAPVGSCRYPVGRPQDIWAVDQGRLYVAQTAAARMERQLRDPKVQAVVRMRLRPDGHVTPLRMEFRPRPAVPPAG